MRKSLTVVLALACLGLAISAGAATKTVDVYGNAPVSPLVPNVPWAQDLMIDKFDPSLGPLTSVHIWITGWVYGDMGYEHTNPNGPTSFFDLDLRAQINVAAPPGASGLNVTLGRHEVEGPVPAFDGTIDYDGPSGTSWSVFEFDGTGQMIVDPSYFWQYIGPGQLALPTVSAGLSTFSSSTTNNKGFINTFARAQVHIAYDYVAMPEMGSLGLASLGGFIGLPLFRRFKK